MFRDILNDIYRILVSAYPDCCEEYVIIYDECIILCFCYTSLHSLEN